METIPCIEEVRSQDLEAALELLTQFFQKHGFTARGGDLHTPLRQMIIDPGSAVFLCSAEGAPLGVVTVTSAIGLEYGRSAEIEDLYVVPKARGRGIGTLLVERALEWCLSAGCSAVLVTLAARGEGHEMRLDFYERHGFSLTSRRLLERGL
jgi:GNAT superfamily N-acetyltransferase